MSDPMKQGHRQSAEYEREDLGARSVFTFLIGLLVMGVLVFGFLKVMLHVLEAYNRSHQPPQHPLAMKSVRARWRYSCELGRSARLISSARRWERWRATSPSVWRLR